MSNPRTIALDAVQEAVLARQISVLAGQRAYAVMGGDPSTLAIPCEAEGCTNTMRLGDSHSIIGVAHTVLGTLATTGPTQVQPTQCPDEQHYGCSLEHALAAHVQCLQEHVFPAHQAKVNTHLATHGEVVVDADEAPSVATPPAIVAPEPPPQADASSDDAVTSQEATPAIDGANEESSPADEPPPAEVPQESTDSAPESLAETQDEAEVPVPAAPEASEQHE